jgi:hypothetical protein
MQRCKKTWTAERYNKRWDAISTAETGLKTPLPSVTVEIYPATVAYLFAQRDRLL